MARESVNTLIFALSTTSSSTGIFVYFFFREPDLDVGFFSSAFTPNDTFLPSFSSGRRNTAVTPGCKSIRQHTITRMSSDW